jgi:DedD protein
MQDLSRYTKRKHVEIQTHYISFLVIGSVALVGLVFVLGILVGSRQAGTAICPVQDPLAALDTRSNEPPPPAIKTRPKLSFHESLLASVDPVPTPASLLSSDHVDPVARDTVATVSGSVQQLLQPRAVEDPIPETVPNDEPGQYSLQVGSFQDRGDATAMIHRLERAGHRAFIISVSMPERGGLWFRVRVGPFHSKKEAWGYKRSFEDKERIPAFVVKRRARG